MARPRHARDDGPRPEALPPEDRPVGQLVAEALRLYGRRFWVALPTGLGLGVLTQVLIDQPAWLWLVVAPPVLAAAFALASVIALPTDGGRGRVATAFVVGLIVFAPVLPLVALLVVPALVWLALAGLAVPVAVVEGTGVRGSFVRAFRLARADLPHAIGAIVALTLLYLVARMSLVILLRAFGEQTERAAVFLADLFLGPIVFLGAALLYVDQAARIGAANRQSRPASSGRLRKRSS